MEATPQSVGKSAYDDLNARLSKVESKVASVKVATPDIINVLDDDTPIDEKIEIMTDLLFEDIGAQEIVNVVRNDIVNGQSVVYQPIKNITSLYYQYNPQNIVALQKTDKEYFKNFPILLYSKIPECGSGFEIDGNQEIPNCQNVYIHPVTGDIVIDLINLRPGEEIEVQLLSGIDDLHDTIY